MSTDERDPFDAYHGTLSGPDVATTSRLENRLDAYLEHGEQRRRSHLLRRILLIGGAVVAVGATVMLWPAAIEDSPALIDADGASQEVTLASGGDFVVAEGGRIRVLQNDAAGTLIELDEGAVEVRSQAQEGVRVRVRVGAFEIEALGPAQARVRKTSSRPEVTVLEGKVVLAGPNLPAQGVEITPAGGHGTNDTR